MKANFLFILLSFAFVCFFGSCSDDFSCTDGKQNQGETGIDCGGPCDACTTGVSCSDGIQNGGETGVDCGGPCSTPCSTTPTCTDGVQNGTETGVDCGGSCSPCAATCSFSTNGSMAAQIDGAPFATDKIRAVSTGTNKLNIQACTGTKKITLNYEGAFQTGTFNAIAPNQPSFSDTGIDCLGDGVVVFTTFNTTTKTVSGTFSFACIDGNTSGGTGTHEVLSGNFTNIVYQ